MSAVEAMSRISQIQSTIRSLTQPTTQQAMGVAVLGTASGAPVGASALATTSTVAAVEALTGTSAAPSSPAASSASSSSSDFAAQLAALSGVTVPDPVGAVPPVGGAATSGPSGADLVEEARRYIGAPYVWGGSTAQGLDCSGLVKLSLSALGVDMPRVAREQMHQGTPVASLAEAEPGDLLVFGGGSHIGIYLGDGRMIDAPKPGDHVRERDVYETPTAIRRVLPTASEAAAQAPALSTAAQVEQLLASSAAERSSLTALLGDAA